MAPFLLEVKCASKGQILLHLCIRTYNILQQHIFSLHHFKQCEKKFAIYTPRTLPELKQLVI